MNLMNKIKALWTWFFAPFDGERVKAASDIPPMAGSHARWKRDLFTIGIVLALGVLIGMLLSVQFIGLGLIFGLQFAFPAPFVAWAIFTGGIIAILCLIRFAVQRANNYSRGMQGEIVTAYELAKTVCRDNWHIFHGLYIPSIDGDIDHIIVSPKGVFAIETKMSRGSVISYENGEVKVDRQSPLRNPNPIKQAKRNAAKLSELIEQKTDMSVWVTPIVCFPGMFVYPGEKTSKMMVINPKQIRKSLPSEDSLGEDQVRKIAKALEKEIRGQ